MADDTKAEPVSAEVRAHYSPGDCQAGKPRHRRSPSSNTLFCQRNRPIGITAGNRQIGQYIYPQSHGPHNRPLAPLRDPPARARDRELDYCR